MFSLPEGFCESPYNKIEKAHKKEEISYDKYILYKTYRTFNHKKLEGTPFSVIKGENIHLKCGTSLILEIKRNWKNLAENTKSQLNFIFKRPTDSNGGIDNKQHLLPQTYSTSHFVFHWTNGEDGGLLKDAPPLTDSDQDGTPDYIENFADIFENVWNFEINTRGFAQPPTDENQPNDGNNRNPDNKYDIFVYDMEVYGYTVAEQYPNSPSYSYIGVDNDYNGFPTSQTGAMQVTAAHEFFHAIQFYYDVEEESWWMETTSVYMEDEVYPSVNDNYQYLPYWFEYCDIYGLKTFDGIHEYGNFIFAKRLSEDFGDEIIKEIWEECKNSDGISAITNVLNANGTNIVDEFKNFAKANFFLEDMYVDGSDYRDAILYPKTSFSGVWREYRYNSSEGVPFVIDSSKVYKNCWMDAWAVDYITFLGLNSSINQYTPFFDGLDLSINYSVNLITKKDSTFTTNSFSLDSAKDGFVYLPYDVYSDIVILIMNPTDTVPSNPSWKVTIKTSPNKPTNTSPTNGETGVLFPIILTSSSFSDTDGDTHSKSFWKVLDSNRTVIYELESSNSLTNIEISNEYFSSGSTYYWSVKYQDSSGTWSPFSDETSFTITTNHPPKKPTNVSPSHTEINVSLTPTLIASKFDDPDEGDTLTTSYWRIRKVDEATYIWEGTSTETSIDVPEDVLENSHGYYWSVKYRDSAGNWSSFSNETVFYTESGTGSFTEEGGGGCFIATAVFNSSSAKEVKILKEYRDKYLLKNFLGKKLVVFYYKHSPLYANIIKKYPFLKLYTKSLLYPFIIFCYFVLRNLLLPLIFLITGICYFFKKLN